MTFVVIAALPPALIGMYNVGFQANTAMMALGATANIAGPNGARSVPVAEFCTGPSRNVLELGEFIVTISFPVPPENSGAAWQRFIPRNEMDIAVVGVGASVTLSDAGDTFESARVALADGTVRPTPQDPAEATLAPLLKKTDGRK